MTQTTLRPIPHQKARASDNVPMPRSPRSPAAGVSLDLVIALLITGLGLVGVLLLIGLPILRLFGAL